MLAFEKKRMVDERYLTKATAVTHLYFEGKVLLCWGFADMNLGTPLLQFQVPTWLGDVKPNHIPPRVYPITKRDNLATTFVGKHAQVRRKRAS